MLDLSEMFTGRTELFYDHVHTTQDGSEALAEAVADFLGRILDQPGQTRAFPGSREKRF